MKIQNINRTVFSRAAVLSLRWVDFSSKQLVFYKEKTKKICLKTNLFSEVFKSCFSVLSCCAANSPCYFRVLWHNSYQESWSMHCFLVPEYQWRPFFNKVTWGLPWGLWRGFFLSSCPCLWSDCVRSDCVFQCRPNCGRWRFSPSWCGVRASLGCCGLGLTETLGELQSIAVACGARLTAVAEAARIVLLWNKLAWIAQLSSRWRMLCCVSGQWWVFCLGK